MSQEKKRPNHWIVSSSDSTPTSMYFDESSFKGFQQSERKLDPMDKIIELDRLLNTQSRKIQNLEALLNKQEQMIEYLKDMFNEEFKKKE